MKLLVWLAALACAAGVNATEPLRVCADPDNLPYSREDGSGFENRIAQLVAEELGRPLAYAWLPDRRGFVRKTMGAGLCDLIIGVPVDFERTSNTRPYYRSHYVLVTRADAEPVQDFDDPRLKHWRIGVQLVGDDMAATPPGHALAQGGIRDNVVGFPIAGVEPAGARMIRALAQGELDAAFLWGPQAGFFAREAGVPLRLHAVAPPPGLASQRFGFAIAMGVHRRDAALRERLDAVLAARRGDVERILDAYGVPWQAVTP